MKKILRWLYKKSEDFLSGRGLNRYYVLRKSAKFLQSQLKSNYAIIDNHKMFLDSEDSLRLSIKGVYEEAETNIIKKLINKGDVVIDIGANIGYYTLIFARLVGNEGKVFAFEPESVNFNLLKKNVELNGYQNVVLVKKAVSNKTGQEKLYLSEDDKGAHSLIGEIENRKSIQIDCIKIDDYFRNNINKIDFIKLDIEGSEIEAIKGMSSVLKKIPNIILMTEFNSYLLKKSDLEPIEFIKLLRKYEFKIYSIDRKKKKTVPIDLDNFFKKYKPEKREIINLLCFKGEKTINL